MYMKKFLSANLDFFGFLNSAICAVHCAVFPILISMGMLKGMFWVEHIWLEMTFLGLSIVFATFSLISSFKKHRRTEPIIMACIGLALLFTGLNISHGPIQVMVMTLGGIVIATAHLLNFNFSR